MNAHITGAGLTALARAQFGAQVSVCAGSITDLQDPLWPDEAALLSRAVPKRVADFTAGRTAARRALAALGWPAVPVPKGPGGAPVWPAGIIGSLSHGGSQCIAAVSDAANIRSLGVDIEPVKPLADGLATEICTVADLNWIADQVDRDDLPLRLFSAKEAAFKALYPLTGVVFGFDGLDVRFSPDRFSFTACLTRQTGPFPAKATFVGRQGLASGVWLSTVVILS